MKRIMLAMLSVLLPIACKDPTGPRVDDLSVSWMEWVQEVEVGKPVKVFIAGYQTCGSTYWRRYEVDEANATILFNPYEIITSQPCESIVPTSYGDTISLAGLASGTYTLRSVDRVFGEVTVTAVPPEASPLNAVGYASMVRDRDGCDRLRPLHVYPRWPVESPPDDWSGGFVTGQLIDPPAPLCGSQRVFRIISHG